MPDDVIYTERWRHFQGFPEAGANMVGSANAHFQDVLQNMAGIRKDRLSFILVQLMILPTIYVNSILLGPMIMKG